jgi:hypothetical protein
MQSSSGSITAADQAQGGRVSAVGELSVTRIRWIYAKQALWYLLVLICVLYPLLLDRRGMIDNDNYVDYFINGRDLAWISLFSQAGSLMEFFVRLWTEEILWLLWTTVVGNLMSPEAGVYFTVAVLNALVAASLRDCRNRSLALALWILMPLGFAVVGTYQIRQGLALAVWLYLGVRRGRLVTGSLVAAMIHTTFGLLAVLSLIATRRELSAKVRLAILGVVCVILALLGEALFQMYGGRRIEAYLQSEEEVLTTNFLIGLFVLMSLPMVLCLSKDTRLGGTLRERGVLQDYQILYLGLMFFLVASFLFFPIGNYRLPYLAWLGLIPIIGQFDFARMHVLRARLDPAVPGFLMLLAFFAYQCLKAVLDNRYSCLYAANCAELLYR